jgi:ribosomal protein L19
MLLAPWLFRTNAGLLTQSFRTFAVKTKPADDVEEAEIFTEGGSQAEGQRIRSIEKE